MTGRASVEALPATWRRQAKALRRYGGDTPAIALESCAAELETTLRERDETTLSLTEAARESGYSADHLGRLVRDGDPQHRKTRRAPDRPLAPATEDPGASHTATGGKASPRRSFQRADRAVHHRGRNRMMARTKPIRRSYGAGEWGRNRVRVFPDPKTGLFQIEWRDNGRRLTRSLKHRDWRRAKRQADEFAAGYLGPEMHGKADAEPEPLTLERLFDIYGEEVTPTKVERVRHRDRTATRMFLDFLGRDRRPETLSQRDWDRFIRERRSGRVGPSGKPVANRMIESDLKFLLAVLNWAVKSKDEQGRPLLEANPLRGLKTPKEKNPTRVVLSDEEYRALLQVSRRVDWRFQVALCSRTRRGTASAPSASFGGPTSTSKKEWCCGAQSTRRPGSNTGRRSPPRRSPPWKRHGKSTPGTGTRRSCPRLGIPRRASAARGPTSGGTGPSGSRD